MRRYIDKRGAGAITHYNLTKDGITLRFSSGHEYHYTEESAGAKVIARMRQLAQSGVGLGSFLLDNKPEHARKRRV